MIYATLREALYDFFTHNAPLVSDGDYYSSEDVFTALPYAKGRRYFDAVALTHRGNDIKVWEIFIIFGIVNHTLCGYGGKKDQEIPDRGADI